MFKGEISVRRKSLIDYVFFQKKHNQYFLIVGIFNKYLKIPLQKEKINEVKRILQINESNALEKFYNSSSMQDKSSNY